MIRYWKAGTDGVESEAVDEQHCDVVIAGGRHECGWRRGGSFKESVYSDNGDDVEARKEERVVTLPGVCGRKTRRREQ